MDALKKEGTPLQYKDSIVQDWMDDEYYSVQVNDSIFKAAKIMSEYEITSIAVVNKDRTVKGIVSSSIVMKAFLSGLPIEQEIQSIMVTEFTTLYADEPINEDSLYFPTVIPVVDREKRLIGSFPSKRKIVNKVLELHEQNQSLDQIVKMYEVCFDTAYEGITVVDENGIIQLFNSSYSRFVRMKKDDVIGKHCTEVIENTRLPVVLETGIPERSNAVMLQGQEMVAHVIPIWKNTKVIGAIGMLVFEGVSELAKAFDKLQVLKETSNKQFTLEIPKQEKEKITFDKIIGESKSIGEVKKIARRAAKTMATVLIIGESGVGKELFAKSIHHLSPVKNGPLISLNCAAIPDELLESELFGYDPGAFTGASKGGKPGKFELAHNGTLFLDEIGDMSLHLQAKLLRVLQEQKFERVGGISEINVNVRIIAATNQPLEKLVEKGAFRKDLYYRLNIVPLHIPPLKNRKADIPVLVSHLLEAASKKHHLSSIKISREVMEKFIQYDWPGNVREMANILESLVVLTDQNQILLQDLPPHLTSYLMPNEYTKPTKTSSLASQPTLSTVRELTQQSYSLPQGNIATSDLLVNQKEANDELERELILSILQKVAGNKSKAAKILGIHRTTLYKKMAKYHLQ
ncbi:sigma 54-interacting transcriptional regulator [Sutcliffiella halmapala]|uniref:sigma 54-interacting transcriptional regulator n=1 Tax=Sutcliffiella halmapala TaxID=79882 RepID=UPI00099587BD|nr:sigma 54-interacting transcriptional regulator [Sutcliffiella halmapala]